MTRFLPVRVLGHDVRVAVRPGTEPGPPVILLDFHVMRHMADMEAPHTYEGTETIQTLIVGRHTTGVGAFVG